MKVAYVDTSALVAIVFGESQATALLRRLKSFDVLVAADLLDAELQATFRRQELEVEPTLPVPLTTIIPDRPLREEIRRVLDAGAVRGAECWHLAMALYLAPTPREIAFFTLDQQQADVARRLGFRT